MFDKDIPTPRFLDGRVMAKTRVPVLAITLYGVMKVSPGSWAIWAMSAS